MLLTAHMLYSMQLSKNKKMFSTVTLLTPALPHLILTLIASEMPFSDLPRPLPTTQV